MVITDFLERNARLYGAEISLVEINPSEERDNAVTWREFNLIDGEIAALEEELARCQAAQEACGSDYVRLQELSGEQSRLEQALEEKMERWVYLTELKEKIDAQS